MKYSLLILMATLFFVSCEKENKCKKCNEAILHMAGKISQNGCNPNYMENAVQRIKDDCAGRANYAIGYLAENCSFNYGGSVGCTEIAYGVSMNDNAKKPIRVYYLYSLTDDTLEVHLRHSSISSFGQVVTLPSFSSGLLEADSYYTNEEGNIFYFYVVNTISSDTVFKGEKTFTYHRPNEWWEERTISIEYNLDSMGYTVAFEHW